MDVWTLFLKTTDAEEVVSRALEFVKGDPEAQLMVLVAEGDQPDLDALRTRFVEAGLSFFGGMFPEVVAEGQRQRRGVLLIKMPRLVAPMAFDNLAAAEERMAGLAASLPDSAAKHPTAFVLVDGLAPDISTFLEAAYNEFGNRVRYWGGGAGSMSLVPTPCVFTSERVFKGGAVIGLSTVEAGLGVRHGWRLYKEPLVATRTEGNVIHQLNWKSALSVYSSHLEADLGRPVDARNVGDFSRDYPLGVKKQAEELVVRDPVGATEDGGLICVGDVPQNAVLAILTGEAKDLIAAAKMAAEDAVPADTRLVRCCLIADCVSRVVFLGDHFQQELDAVSDGLGPLSEGQRPCGVLTLGEISSRGDGYLELFNKTCVVAVLHGA